MSKSIPFKKLAVCVMMTGLSAASQVAFAHTSLQVNTINEKTRTYNNVVIGHGCNNPVTNSTSNEVIAQSVVFPDGIDSTVTRSDGNSATSVAEFVTNWISFGSKVKSPDVFEKEGLKLARGSSVNYTGFYGIEGELPGLGYLGLIPFRTASVNIDPASCAKSVTFQLAIADICKITKADQLSDETVNTWMPAGTGSNFDDLGLDGYGEPATLKVVRTSVLPGSCGAGFDVTVTPSGAQINHDLPILKKNGEQYWPKK